MKNKLINLINKIEDEKILAFIYSFIVAYLDKTDDKEIQLD